VNINLSSNSHIIVGLQHFSILLTLQDNLVTVSNGQLGDCRQNRLKGGIE
jgi:hypothetical protein